MTPEALIKIRRQSGMTQKELAYSLEISRQHLSDLESGKHKVSKDLEQTIAGILRKDISKVGLPQKASQLQQRRQTDGVNTTSLTPKTRVFTPVSDLRETCRKYQEGRCLMSGCPITYSCYRRVKIELS